MPNSKVVNTVIKELIFAISHIVINQNSLILYDKMKIPFVQSLVNKLYINF